MTGEKKTIVLAAGGTGGHIFPAEALAGSLLREHDVVLMTDRRYVRRATTPGNMQVRVIMAASPSGNVIKKIIALLSIVLGMLQAYVVLRKIKPDVVIGFGGYPSFPTLCAAVILGLPTVIHEQNAVLGKVNRMLAKYVDKLAVSFEDVAKIPYECSDKVVFTGNPVRQEIAAIRDVPYSVLKRDEHLHLLVVGGSQGAQVLSDVVPKAILLLPAELRDRIRLDQQCRVEDIEQVREIYAKAGVNVDLASFFDDMSVRLAAAHLVIARSGASTVMELLVAGRPAILVPFMYATDDHQMANAKNVEAGGAAVVISQKTITAEILAGFLQGFLEDPSSLEEMARNAAVMGGGDAVEKLGELVVSS